MSPVKIVYELVHFSKIRKQNIEIVTTQHPYRKLLVNKA